MKWLLSIVVVILVAIVASSVLVVTGESSKCAASATTTAAKSEREIVESLKRDRIVTITDVDATTSAKNRLGSIVTDPRVCFDPQGGHASGKFSLGPVSFSAYLSVASSDLDLSGSYPKISKLDIRLGSLPSVPGISDAAGTLIANSVNQSLADIKLDKPMTAQFSAGSVTLRQ